MIYEVINNEAFNYFMSIFAMFFVPIFIYVTALSFIK